MEHRTKNLTVAPEKSIHGGNEESAEEKSVEPHTKASSYQSDAKRALSHSSAHNRFGNASFTDKEFLRVFCFFPVNAYKILVSGE